MNERNKVYYRSHLAARIQRACLELRGATAEFREASMQSRRVLNRLWAQPEPRPPRPAPAPRPEPPLPRLRVVASTDALDMYGNRVVQVGMQLPADGRVDVLLGHEPAKVGTALMARGEHQSTTEIDLDNTSLGREAARLWKSGVLWGASVELWPLEILRHRRES